MWTSLSWPSSVILLTSRLFPWLHPLEMDYLSWHFAEYNFKFKVHRMCGYSLSFAWDAILLWTRPILWVSMRFIFKHNFPITYKFWENNLKNVCLAESCCTHKTSQKNLNVFRMEYDKLLIKGQKNLLYTVFTGLHVNYIVTQSGKNCNNT